VQRALHALRTREPLARHTSPGPSPPQGIRGPASSLLRRPALRVRTGHTRTTAQASRCTPPQDSHPLSIPLPCSAQVVACLECTAKLRRLCCPVCQGGIADVIQLFTT
jgi:hypothetical protein